MCNNFDWSLMTIEHTEKTWKGFLFRPYHLYNDAFYNILTPNMDSDMAEYDISGDRYPRYSSIVKLKDHYTLVNVGRKPKSWKF